MTVIDYKANSELRNFANDRTFDARTTMRKSAEARSPAGASFLSHSSKDNDLLVGAIRVTPPERPSSVKSDGPETGHSCVPRTC